MLFAHAPWRTDEQRPLASPGKRLADPRQTCPSLATPLVCSPIRRRSWPVLRSFAQSSLAPSSSLPIPPRRLPTSQLPGMTTRCTVLTNVHTRCHANNLFIPIRRPRPTLTGRPCPLPPTKRLRSTPRLAAAVMGASAPAARTTTTPSSLPSPHSRRAPTPETA